jgi:glycine/D-amino acid oxidase-like deaminating enzyme
MNRTRYGTPIWLDRPLLSKRAALPRLKEDLESEVVVIGGGLTGCLVACQFARAAVRTVLVEAGEVGETAALDAGTIVESPGVGFRELQQLYGLRAARRAYELSRRAALDSAAFLRRLSIRCDLTPRQSVVMATTVDQLRELEREHQARVAAGVEAAWLTGRRAIDEVRTDSARAAVKTHSEASLDPFRACRGILAAAIRAKARVFENTPVKRIKPAAKFVDVATERGIIRARTAVVATGAPRPLVPALQRHVRVAHTYHVATPELPRALQARLVSETIVRDVSSPAHLVVPIAGGRLLVQGGDQAAVPARLVEKALVQRTGQLMYELSLLYPSISGIVPEYAWMAPRVTARDGLMLVGAHRNFPRHLFALGLGSAGLAGAWLASRILLRQYTGEPEAGDEVFGFARFLG